MAGLPMMYMPRTLWGSLSARQGLAHDLDHRVARRLIQLGRPELLKRGMRARVVHPLVVGEHHRDQPRVARALHVVLAAQRVQARARARRSGR